MDEGREEEKNEVEEEEEEVPPEAWLPSNPASVGMFLFARFPLFPVSLFSCVSCLCVLCVAWSPENDMMDEGREEEKNEVCLLYTSPSPRD